MAEALRLADAICDYARYGYESETQAQIRRAKAHKEAAAELRRLHAENERLAALVCDYAAEESPDALRTLAADRDRWHAKAQQAEEQRDALLEALKIAWPIIEAEKYKQDCSYGKNFVQTKADRARKAYEATRAAIRAVEGEKT